MNTKKQALFFLLAKLPLLLLYALFFMVQLFYNFDSNQQGTASALKFLKAVHPSAQTINKAQASSTKSPVFRLNKRYQPQPVITCSIAGFTKLVCPVSSKLHIHYSAGFTPATCAAAHTLRGPPVV